MTAYAALLRAINVGGTGKLPMADLRALCEACGFRKVATYIQSGNVVFQSKASEASVKKTLERALEEKMGKPYPALIRSAAELASVIEQSPFPSADPKKVLIVFMDKAPGKSSLDGVVAPGGEQLVLSGRELFIYFPDGMGRSKLKVPFRELGTGRNPNTVAKLVTMLEAIG